MDDPITSFDMDRMRSFIDVIENIKGSYNQLILLVHYVEFMRSITRTINPKNDKEGNSMRTLIKLVKDQNGVQVVKIEPDDDLFKTALGKNLDKIIKFMNAETHDISENDVRIYVENYIKNEFAYETSKINDFKNNKIHDYIINLNKFGIIDDEKKESLHVKLRFLNESSHEFVEYSEEDKRNLLCNIYQLLHEL